MRPNAMSFLAVLLLAGCGSTPEAAVPPTTTMTTTTIMTTTTSEAAPPDLFKDEQIRARLGALDTIVWYCVPGNTGGLQQGCDLGRILTAFTELTTSMRQKIDTAANPAKYAAAAAAIATTTKSVAALAPCKTWYAANGKDPDRQVHLQCRLAWNDLEASWRPLKSAARWP